MAKFFKWCFILASVLCVILVALAYLGVQGAKREDPWYTEALAATSPEAMAEMKVAGEAFEKQAIELKDQALDPGQWEAVFTDKQINGWLALDDVDGERVPRALPSSVQQPRVKFEPDLARIACHVKNSRLDSVLFIGLDIKLTGKPNELSVRLTECRAGIWPIPVSQIKKVVDKTAAKANLTLTWTEVDGDQIALIQVPERNEDVEGRLVLEKVEIREGELHLSGKTIRDDGTGSLNDMESVIVSQLFEKDLN